MTALALAAGLLAGACGGGEPSVEKAPGADQPETDGTGRSDDGAPSPTAREAHLAADEQPGANAGAALGAAAEAATVTVLATDEDADPMDHDVSGLDAPVATKIEEAREVVRLDPNDPERWRALGHTYQSNRIPGLAVAAYERALDLDGRHARTWYHLALAQHAADDLEGALTSIDAALGHDATVPAYHWRRANWLFDFGRIEEAETGYDRALALDPNDAAAVAGKARVQMDRDELAPAMDALGRLLETSGDMPFASYVRKLLATAYRRDGQTERAGALDAIGTDGLPIWFDPAEIEVARFAVETIFHRAARAADLANRGDFEGAITEMRAVVEDNPEEPARRNQLARFYDLAGRDAEAIAEYQETLRRQPDEREALVQLGKLLGQGGDLERGLELLDRAIELQPLYPPAHFYRGSLLRRADRIEEAAAAYRRAVELDETKRTPWIAVGRLELQLEEWSSALQAFERALELGLDRGDVWLGKAECLLQLRRLDEAQEALDAGRLKQPFDTQRWMGVQLAVQNERNRLQQGAGREEIPPGDGSPANQEGR